MTRSRDVTRTSAFVLALGIASCAGAGDSASRDRPYGHPIEVAAMLLGADYPDPVVPAPTSSAGGQVNGFAAELIGDLAAWDRADHDGRVETAECIAIKYREFVFAQMEKVSRGGVSRDVAVFLYRGHPEEQYALVPGWIQGGAEATVRVAPFLMARQVVSDAEWMEVMSPTDSSGGSAERPAVGVSWLDAARFCMRRHVELPTETEWEHACRAGERLRDTPSDAANRAWKPECDLAWVRKITATNGLALAEMPGHLWELTDGGAASADLPAGVVARGGLAADDADALPIGRRMIVAADERVADVAVRPIFRVRGPWPFPPKKR